MNKTPRFTAKSLTKRHQNFANLYKSCALPLMKFLIKKMGGDQIAAEEVFSQTVLAAWKGWHTFEHKSSYFTWVCRIGLNKMADYYRQQINERSKLVVPTLEILANIKDNHLNPEEKLALEELRSSIRDCLDLLPDEKRQLLYMRFWKELTMKEIADTLGVSERAAEGQVYRAKLAFRQVLVEKYPDLH